MLAARDALNVRGDGASRREPILDRHTRE